MLSAVQLVRRPVSYRTTWYFVVAQDRDGRIGVGECSDAGPQGDVETVFDAIDAALPEDLDAGTLDEVEERLVSLGAQVRGGGNPLTAHTVIGGLEMALADLVGQRAGAPLCEILGTATPGRVPLYANINRALRTRTPEEFADVARRAGDAGFTAVKCAPFDDLVEPSDESEAGLRCVRAVRDAVGPDVTVMVDVHHRLTYRAVLDALPAFEEIGLGWLEDAVSIEDPQRLEDLASRTSLPLAGGELSRQVDEVVRAVAHGLQVVMPDVKHAGGLRRAQHMAAAVAPATVSFHNPSGPVGTLASGHLTLACANASILEYAFGEVPWRPDVVIPAEQIAEGALVVPDAVGTGAQLAPAPPTI